MYFHDELSRLCALPLSWTSLTTPDAFVALAAGRAWFRVVDLVEAAALIARYRGGV